MSSIWQRVPPGLQRFGKFLLVGGVNTLVGYLLYAVFLKGLRLSPHAALTWSFWLGVLWNYFSTARFVFGKSGFRRLPAYVLCYLAVYALNAMALSRALAIGIDPLLAQAMLVPVTAVLTFLLVGVVLTGSIGRAGLKAEPTS